MSKSTVWVMINNLKHDFSPAKEFGDIRYVFPATMSRDYNPKSVVAYVRDVLSKMEEDDYLVPAGDPTLYAVAVACALEQFGKFNTLRWDNVNKRYDSMLFDFDYEDSTQ